MQTEMWKIAGSDLLKSGLTAALAAILVAIANMATQQGFDLFAVDWKALANLVLNVGISAFIADIARRFSTDKQGRLFGKI